MKEIIDLAFKLTAMKYLDLQDYPIFLDEFARGMDSAHRVTSIEAIKSLMESSSSSQLFMISHYENSYSCLVNAQICVICPENIVIPKDAVVNQHVTIK
jgi:ABC-type Mn2+/Zn2+ transport system ATPase subunit